VEFRLVYRGPLASDGDATEKQLLRKAFHPQLAELWKHHPLLSKQVSVPVRYYHTPKNLVSYPGPGVPQVQPSDSTEAKPWIEHLADQFVRGNYRFAPLVRKGQVVCSLDILFLRRDSPGHLIKSTGGDIDNRMKTLFDGLRIAKSGEVGKFKTPDAGEIPFYCLLEDDDDIVELRITTDRLLTPQESLEHRDNVHLIIHVKTQTVDPEALFAEVHSL
jgi:hypothetical protein